MKVLPSLIKHLADGVGGGLIWFLANLDNSMDTKDRFSSRTNNNNDNDNSIPIGVIIFLLIIILLFHILMAMASYKLTENKILHTIMSFLLGTFWIMFVWIYFGVFSKSRFC